MSNPNVSYFFRKFYNNIIKWWYVVYNPVARRIWPSKQEEEAALLEEERIRAEEEAKRAEEEALRRAEEEERRRLEEEARLRAEEEARKAALAADLTYNETTGSFSGLYGKGPMDASTQAALDEIMGKNKKNDDFSSLAQAQAQSAAPTNAPSNDEQAAILAEANAIYERLMREAAEDEAKKQAEIDAAKAAQNN